jgi:hypothetical protein
MSEKGEARFAYYSKDQGEFKLLILVCLNWFYVGI